MPEYKAYNNLETALSNSINSSATTLYIEDDLTDLTPPFKLTINDSPIDFTNSEIVNVNSVSSTSISVTRGVEDTTAQSWSSGTKMYHLGTAGMYNNLENDFAPIDMTILIIVKLI